MEIFSLSISRVQEVWATPKSTPKDLGVWRFSRFHRPSVWLHAQSPILLPEYAWALGQYKRMDTARHGCWWRRYFFREDFSLDIFLLKYVRENEIEKMRCPRDWKNTFFRDIEDWRPLSVVPSLEIILICKWLTYTEVSWRPHKEYYSKARKRICIILMHVWGFCNECGKDLNDPRVILWHYPFIYSWERIFQDCSWRVIA